MLTVIAILPKKKGCSYDEWKFSVFSLWALPNQQAFKFGHAVADSSVQVSHMLGDHVNFIKLSLAKCNISVTIYSLWSHL